MSLKFYRRAFVAAFVSGYGIIGLENALAADGGDANFLALSRFLTGRTDLDPDLSKRFFSALTVQDPHFVQKLKHLAAAIASQAPQSVDALDLISLSPADQSCALAIIAAWYSGMVGSGPGATLVTFNAALLYDFTRDAVTVPTYCAWGYDYWTASPPSAPMAGFAPLILHPAVRYRWFSQASN